MGIPFLLPYRQRLRRRFFYLDACRHTFGRSYWMDNIFSRNETTARQRYIQNASWKTCEKGPGFGISSSLDQASYSLNVGVLAFNNLGAADIGLGNLDTARAHLDLAIKLDPSCPLLYRNMYTLLMRIGPYADAQPWLVKAGALGMKGGVTDRMVQSSQPRNAAWSSIGRASSARMSGPLLKPPVAGAYVINLINDDVTPLEVVIAGLEKVFDMTGAEAFGAALEVCKAAQAECAGFPDEITARRKADELQAFA